MNGLAIGFGLGFLVAVQVGPMSLFLIRSTLRSGVRIGLAIAAGVALVDAAYASLGVGGAAPLLSFDALRVVFGVVGAAVLVGLGARTFSSAFRVRTGFDGPADVSGPRRAFLTSLGATASNPMTIVSWAAIFAATSSATGARPAALVLGVAVGSLTWMVTLACVIAIVRRATGPRALRAADAIAGLGMIGFGGLLAYRTADSP
jgi:putative LysE/RhtB family amino acid efflux pump